MRYILYTRPERQEGPGEYPIDFGGWEYAANLPGIASMQKKAGQIWYKSRQAGSPIDVGFNILAEGLLPREKVSRVDGLLIPLDYNDYPCQHTDGDRALSGPPGQIGSPGQAKAGG